MTAIKINDISYQFQNWAELGQDIFELAKKIIESGEQFDRVIALAKGGLTFSRSLVDYLNIEDVSSLHIEFYNSINSTNTMPVITQSIPVSLKNEKVLLFDDLVDSGRTMETALEYLKHRGVASVKTAAFFYKPKTSITPDFFVREVSAWIVFPNELRETTLELANMWSAKGMDTDKIQIHLNEIGLPQEQTQFYLSQWSKHD
ncbi:MAG: phosphoribosyltransferase [Patescibacteria group bacterium]